MKKNFKPLICFSLLLLSIFYFSCNEKDLSQANNGNKKNSNNLEKPLSSIKSSSNQSQSVIANKIAAGATYGCGSSLTGNYAQAGYYTYPDYALDVS